MSDANVEARFSIGELSRRTQVNTVTLRAWERRYGLLKPTRTSKGHRLYSDDDVARVRDILAWIARGVPVSKVRELLGDELTLQIGQGLKTDIGTSDSHWADAKERLEYACSHFRADQTQALLQEVLGQYPVAQAMIHWLEPAFQHLLAQRAAALFLQSEIIRYTIMRLYRQPHVERQILLLCGEGSEVWRLALAALRLADAGIGVNLLNQPCSVSAWCELVEQCIDRSVLILQDGQLSHSEMPVVQQLLCARDNIFLCGSAGVLAFSENKQAARKTSASSVPAWDSSAQVFSSLDTFLELYMR